MRKLKGTSQKVKRANVLLKADWALEMGRLMEGHYADGKKVNVVCDNLNTHTMGAFS